jgi:hypothetical protein
MGTTRTPPRRRTPPKSCQQRSGTNARSGIVVKAHNSTANHIADPSADQHAPRKKTNLGTRNNAWCTGNSTTCLCNWLGVRNSAERLFFEKKSIPTEKRRQGGPTSKPIHDTAQNSSVTNLVSIFVCRIFSKKSVHRVSIPRYVSNFLKIFLPNFYGKSFVEIF